MTISGRTRILAALGAALALTITGPAYAGSGPSSKVVGKPTVGECRHLTLAQAGGRTDTSDPIACSKAHNSRVIAVPNLPGGATYADVNTVAKQSKAGLQVCYPALRKAVGQGDRTLGRTAYTILFFTPTKQQQADGARWVRCDLAILHGTRYGNLPTDRVPALRSSHVPANAARCLTGKNTVATTCATRHSFRATGSFTVPSKTFPGRKKVIQLGRQRCPSMVTTRDYLFTWKLQEVYNLVHDRTVVCFSKTSH